MMINKPPPSPPRAIPPIGPRNNNNNNNNKPQQQYNDEFDDFDDRKDGQSNQDSPIMQGFHAHNNTGEKVDYFTLNDDHPLSNNFRSGRGSKKKKKSGFEIRYDDIKFGPLLGQGSFGKVYKGTLWGQEVAIKKLLVTADSINDFKKEVKIMKNLRHPNIVEFLGATFEKKGDRMVMVTEFLSGGSLEALVDRYATTNKKFSTKRILTIAQDVARGLAWLHHKGIIHRDLKTANLLLDSHGRVKIADFGLSHIKKREGYKGTYGVYGTPCYCAPEVINRQPYDMKCDVFSFGVVLAELVLGKYPYEGAPESTMTFERAIVTGLRPQLPNDIQEGLKSIIERCWQDNPELRPSMDQVLQELFLVEERLKVTYTIMDDLNDEQHKMFNELQQRFAELRLQYEALLSQHNDVLRANEELRMENAKMQQQPGSVGNTTPSSNRSNFQEIFL